MGNSVTIYYCYFDKYNITTWTIKDNAEIYVYHLQGDYTVTSLGY